MGIFEGHFTNWPASHREGGKLFYHPQGSRSHTLFYIALHHDLCWWGLHDRSFFLILLRGYVDLSQIRGIKKSWSGLLQEEDTWNLLGFHQFTVPSVLPLLSPPTNPDPSYTNSWLIPWISSVVPIKWEDVLLISPPVVPLNMWTPGSPGSDTNSPLSLSGQLSSLTETTQDGPWGVAAYFGLPPLSSTIPVRFIYSYTHSSHAKAHRFWVHLGGEILIFTALGPLSLYSETFTRQL